MKQIGLAKLVSGENSLRCSTNGKTEQVVVGNQAINRGFYYDKTTDSPYIDIMKMAAMECISRPLESIE